MGDVLSFPKHGMPRHSWHEFMEEDGRHHTILLPDDAEKTGMQICGDDGKFYTVKRCTEHCGVA